MNKEMNMNDKGYMQMNEAKTWVFKHINEMIVIGMHLLLVFILTTSWYLWVTGFGDFGVKVYNVEKMLTDEELVTGHADYLDSCISDFHCRAMLGADWSDSQIQSKCFKGKCIYRCT